ncbi:hypothetical protein V6N13_065094 [Hibiscus sabdariffa]
MNLQWNIGNGVSTKFWQDSWIKDIGPLIHYVPTNVVHVLGHPSVADMVFEQQDWRWDVLHNLLPSSVVLRLKAIKALHHGRFTVRSAYRIHCGIGLDAHDSICASASVSPPARHLASASVSPPVRHLCFGQFEQSARLVDMTQSAIADVRQSTQRVDGLAKLASIGNFEEIYYSIPPPSIQPLTIVDTGS